MGIFGRIAGSQVSARLLSNSADKSHWIIECSLQDKLIASVPRIYSVISVSGQPPVFAGPWEGSFHILGNGRARSVEGDKLNFFVHGVLANYQDACKLLASSPLKDGYGD